MLPPTLLDFDFSKAPILVVGDIMLDEYRSGETKRLSPEAPVPVVQASKRDYRLGGAANVALNIQHLQGQVQLISSIGLDWAGSQLKQLLLEKGLAHVLIEDEHKMTPHKLRILSRQQQLLRIDEESLHPLSSKTLQDRFLSHYQKALEQVRVVILSDYAKGSLSGLHQTLIRLAKAKACLVIVDPKLSDVSVYAGADVITPNLSECTAWVGLLEDEQDRENKIQALLKTHAIQSMVLTRSEAGLSVFVQDTPVVHIPTQAQSVSDVTGAGDTVMAALALGLAKGLDLKTSASLANVAAGKVVAKLGTASLSLPELEEAYAAVQQRPSGVLRLSDLQQQRQFARLRGERVVFTNGCFDLLHAGHVDYLNEAKALGDRLIVAVNTDESVKRLKGESRPIIPLAERMRVLANLKAVDWVVAFSEDTPVETIEALLPDVLVKGGDYQDKWALPGAREVKAHGGEVHILSLTGGCSTSNIVAKIQKQLTMTVF